MLSQKSIEQIEEKARKLVSKSSGVFDSRSCDEFVRYLHRYNAHVKTLKSLSIDSIEPIKEGKGGRPETKPSPGSDAGVDQPFIESLEAKAAAEAAAASAQEIAAATSKLAQGLPVEPTAVEDVKLNENTEPEQFVNCKRYQSIPSCPDDLNLTHELLNKLVILRLNGGLGTSMGCKGSKSAIEVRNSLTFLDMAVRQVEFLNTKHGVDVPLVLMNSFNTYSETERVISKYAERHVKIELFCQSSFPRLDKSSLETMPRQEMTADNQGLWYPPGHGDVYTSLARSGMLQKLIGMGKEYIFISNIDNLGATVDLNILYHIMENDDKFCMEVTKRERQDAFGGILVEYKKKPLLLETTALSKQLGDTLRRDKRFDKFNTNNLWINLRHLQSLVSVRKSLELPAILREKPVRDQERGEIQTMTFETSAGAAISLFEDVSVVVVPRDRFLPVKTTDDLFAVQSDLFTVRHGSLRFSELRTISPPVPTVKLGPYFRSVEEYSKRLPFGVPDIVDLEHLTVSGDVNFRNHVVLKGTVIIVAEEGSHIDICSGSVIRDKVITGNLRIMDH